MAEHTDTVRLELSDILSEIHLANRVSNPNEVVLFAHGDTSYGINDITAQISQLGYDGAGHRIYDTYSYGIKSGNHSIGILEIDARRGLIGVSYKPTTSGQQNQPELSFKMEIGFGSRVMDYKVKGSDGTFRGAFAKFQVKDMMKDTLSKIR